MSTDETFSERDNQAGLQLRHSVLADTISLSEVVSSEAECHLTELKFINSLIACKHGESHEALRPHHQAV